MKTVLWILGASLAQLLITTAHFFKSRYTLFWVEATTGITKSKTFQQIEEAIAFGRQLLKSGDLEEDLIFIVHVVGGEAKEMAALGPEQDSPEKLSFSKRVPLLIARMT